MFGLAVFDISNQIFWLKIDLEVCEAQVLILCNVLKPGLVFTIQWLKSTI